MRKFILNCGLAILLCVLPFTASAQLVTVDDSFGVPVFQTLVTGEARRAPERPL